MPDTGNTFAKPVPLLPADKAQDRPLFMVLAILAFLATLALLGIKTGIDAGAKWTSEFTHTANVQIKPKPGDDLTALAEKTRTVLLNFQIIRSVEILSPEDAAALMAPWLGDVSLPSDLPVPVPVTLILEPDKSFDTDAIRAALNTAGINANVSAQNPFAGEIKSSLRGLRFLSLLAFTLICLAVFAASVFASRASLATRRTLINLLQHIGATPAFSANRFGCRFALTSLKASAAGALAALIAMGLVALMTRSSVDGIGFLPDVRLGLSELLLASVIPVLMTAITGMSVWGLVRSIMKKGLYP